MTEVALSIITYRRPDGLRRLLHSVATMIVPDDVDLRVVVVDNDPAGSSRAAVEEAALPCPVVYDVEPERGIPYARNRAVALAGDVDFVAFIDDDEAPRPDWLEKILAVQRETRAEVVIGPSVPVFDGGVPAWIREGGFFERTRFRTGAEIPYNHARTSGVIVDAALFREAWPPFDEAYAISGGSDRHFFHRADLAGRRFVWADEAVVHELVPSTRATARWLLQRAYRTGNSRSLTLVDLEGSVARRCKRVAAGAWAFARGAFLAVAAVARRRGRAALVHALRESAYGVGLVTGVLGWRAREYKHVHGH